MNNLRCLILLYFVFSFTNAKAQFVTIPDSNFVAFLTTNYPSCMNGNQMDTMCVDLVNGTSVYCSSRWIQDLTGIEYFDNLMTLYCNGNQLTTLPPLPASLQVLHCQENQLTSLPSLPASLWSLICYKNQLTSMPFLPASLSILYCGYNQLTSLPSLPASLLSLYCEFNQLTILPDFPDTLGYLNTSNNSNLYCLPDLKVFTGSANYFNISNTGISCLPNVIQHTGSIPAIDTMPICDILNTNGCLVSWNIHGIVASDPDTHCITDDGVGMPMIKMSLYDSTLTLLQQLIANWNGQYSFEANTGSYILTIDTTGLPFDVLCPAGNSYSFNITAIDSIEDDVDFKLVCKPGFDVGTSAASVASGVVRPGNTASINIHAGDMSSRYNMACATGISGDVTVILSGPASYVSPDAGALTPTVNGDTLIYAIADFAAVDFQNDFGIIIHTDTTAQAGQQVCFDVAVNPIAGDNNPSNNTLLHCFNVVNSYDPNDKQVYPAGNIDPAQEWLTYTIRFQNTGNAPAQHIYIADTLDANIDEEVFSYWPTVMNHLYRSLGKRCCLTFPTSTCRIV